MKKILFTCLCLFLILAGYSQNNNANINTGALTLEANIPPNPTAGTICWTGKEFLGFNGVQWIALNESESGTSTVPIKIWSYLFQFPKTFSLVPVDDGTDAYVGTIEGAGITLNFEHTFLNEITDVPISTEDKYISNIVDGHYIEIIQRADSQNDITKLHINKTVSNTDGSYSNSKLTISVNNITRAQQNMLVDVFSAVEIVEPSVPIKIGRYQFQFPVGFSLVPGQGIDSYIGNINGAGISLSFDYGAYTGPSSNLPPTEYVVTEDEIAGNFRQIVKPVDTQNNFTKLYMYNFDAALDNYYFHSRLTLRAKNITLAQQEMIVDIFNAVEILY